MNAHPIHMQVNSPELMKQHRAAQERKARLARRAVWGSGAFAELQFDAHVLQKRWHDEMMSARYPDANAHVQEWRSFKWRSAKVNLRDQADAHVFAWRKFYAAPAPMGRRPDMEVYNVNVREIATAVATFYGVSMMDIISQRRAPKVVLPRQVVMFLARELTPKSFSDIGAALGGRDHSTIQHGAGVIDKKMKANAALAGEIYAIRCTLVGEGK